MSSLVLALPDALPGSLITEDKQIEWRGMLFGPNSFFGYKKLSGWEDLPPLDGEFTPIPRAHGTYPGNLYSAEKVVTFESQMYPEAASMREVVYALRARTGALPDRAEEPLIVRQHGESLLAYARVTGRTLPIDRKYFDGYPKAIIQWTLADPRRYSLTEYSAVVTPAVISGGLPWGTGLDWDTGLSWGTVSGGAPPSINNAGTIEGPFIVDFAGPWTGPFGITNGDWTLLLTSSLGADEVISIDTRTGTLTNESGADASLELHPSSDIPEDCTLDCGVNTIMPISGSSTDTGTGTIRWRDTHL